MKQYIATNDIFIEPKCINWPAIISLFIGVTSLITSEFIPICLLTPIAQDLHISEGLAGQSITVVAIMAVVTSLLISPVSKSINRKIIIVGFSILLMISNLIVMSATNYFIMLIGRGILGICVGGFWSMASAVALQLAPTKDLARALGIIYAGVSVATIISLPISSYLGDLLGWRDIFFIVALLGLVALVSQVLTLPCLIAQANNNFKCMISLLKSPWVLGGIIAIILSYSGYHLFFSYLRPYLQIDLKLIPSTLTLTLLIFSVANCLGTYLAGYLLSRFFKSVMISVHLTLSSTAIMLFLCEKEVIEDIVLTITWGFLFGFIPVGWSMWISKTLPDKAELMGGLSVASIQFSIGMAAALGGFLLNNGGINYIFIMASSILLLAIFFIIISFLICIRMTGVSL